MTLRVEVDLTSAVPPYEQVRAQITAHVAAGRLCPGDRLPTVRALAADLGLATNTVARAYKELEAHGLVLSRRRVGTVVAPGVAPGAPPDREVSAAAYDLVARARRAGLSDEAVVDLVRGALLGPSPVTAEDRPRHGGDDHPR